VAGFVWWYMFYEEGPQVSWWQLINFHSCDTKLEEWESLLKLPASLPQGCEIFHQTAHGSTMSLSVLVVIEMFNALNALSENQSLLSVPPWSNPFVLLAIAISMALHFLILYVPWCQGVFKVADLNTEEWLWVVYLSFPIILIDEVLKFISRRLVALQLLGRRKHDAQVAISDLSVFSKALMYAAAICSCCQKSSARGEYMRLDTVNVDDDEDDLLLDDRDSNKDDSKRF